MKYAYPTGASPEAMSAWAKRLVDDLNRPSDYVAGLGTFANDTDAAAGGVKVGEGYKTAAGVVRWRAA